MPALTRTTNNEPPTTTTAIARPHAASAVGCDIRDNAIVALISRHASDIRLDGSRSIANATRKRLPTTGAASSSLNSDAADAWMSVTCQFAAAISAPRLTAAFKGWGDMACSSMLPKVLDVRCPGPVAWSQRATNGLQCTSCAFRTVSAAISPFPWRRLVGIAVAGAACALVVLALGCLTERIALGSDEAAARARTEAEVRASFDIMARALRLMALGMADSEVVVAAAQDDVTAASRLFAAASAAIAQGDGADFAVTAYDVNGEPMAWDGRPSELPAERLQSDEAWFFTQGALGLRLVYVTPVRTADGRRIGAVAAERARSASRSPLGPTAARTRSGMPAEQCLSRSIWTSRLVVRCQTRRRSRCWIRQAPVYSPRQSTRRTLPAPAIVGGGPHARGRSQRLCLPWCCSVLHCSTGETECREFDNTVLRWCSLSARLSPPGCCCGWHSQRNGWMRLCFPGRSTRRRSCTRS